MVTWLAWLAGFAMPACAAEGAAGLPVPPVMDMTRIERPATPNTFLAGPSHLTPDRVVEPLSIPADALYARARAVFDREAWVFVAADYPAARQVHYVVRSRLLNYPDLIAVEARPAGDGSVLTIWSRSVYGRSDFGVNKARVEAWLAALRSTNER